MSSHIWFDLVDSNGNAFKGTRPDAIPRQSNMLVLQLKDAIKSKYSDSILKDVASSQLAVYSDKSMKTLLQEDLELDHNNSENVYGKSLSEALVIVVNVPSTASVPSLRPRDRDQVLFKLYKFAGALGIQLKNEDEFPQKSQLFRIKDALFTDLINALVASKINVLCIDEAQRQLDLVEFMIKNNCDPGNHGKVKFVICGTPPHGLRTIDYGGSALSRGRSFCLSPLNSYQVLCILNYLFRDKVSTKTWLDFWSLFNGEPYLYHDLDSYLKTLTDEKRSDVAVQGITDEQMLRDCCGILGTGLAKTGISAEIRSEIGSGKPRKAAVPGLQAQIEQLLSRNILNLVVKVSDFLDSDKPKSTTLIWNDYLIEMDAKGYDADSMIAFTRRRGFGLEHLVHSAFEWHLLQDTVKDIFEIDCKKLNICTLSYEGDTDADLLIIEKPGSTEEINQDKKLRAFIFNVKSNVKWLLGEHGKESKLKFEALCERFATRFYVTLCLMVSDVKDAEKEILQQWTSPQNHCYKLWPKVMSLSDLAGACPDIQIHGSPDRDFVVDRNVEKSMLISTVDKIATNLFIQGRYRVGKTTLLKQICKEREDWYYYELPKDSNGL